MRLKAEMAELDYLVREADDDEALRTLMTRKQVLLSQRHAIDVATASDIHG
jgi:hypothetical protein